MPESYNKNAHNQSYLCVCLSCITKYVLMYANNVLITFMYIETFTVQNKLSLYCRYTPTKNQKHYLLLNKHVHLAKFRTTAIVC